ncbi:aldo/keto reductase [Bacillus sp. 2205SS5-2]|uniref:aldo/keto reductase n=1 Tax=Bacillus sp. 2205SS5-2 TaxID=3109031 RepID=UPI003007A893
MEKRQLGRSSLSVSKMGLGCMSLGTNEEKAKTIIEAALEQGITYFDTADLYDFGVNEKIVGRALHSVREEVIIATKVGNRWKDDHSSWQWDPSKAYIKEGVKNSLTRLNTDYIDLYQLHGGTMDDPLEETIEAFEELKQEGFIRSYGISSIRSNVIEEFVKKSSIDTVMMQYNLLDRRPEEIFPFLQEQGISVVTRGPLAKGILSEAMLQKASQKIKKEGYLDYSYLELQELLASINERFTSHHSMTELSLQFNLAQGAVSAVIPGASSVDQLKSNIAAANGSNLSTEEGQLLREMTKISFYDQHRD